MTNENQKLRNDHISVPVWLAPMLIASFVVLGLGYVVSLSADDAQQRVDMLRDAAQVRFASLEETDKDQHTNIMLVRQEIGHLTAEVTKAGRSSEQNTRLLNRIANKLDVEMD
tara:strand:- start:207 stop:545 length:339 start_codon:yes stop_codon:yes gene_type:complete